MTNRIIISGYYGEKNTGDDAFCVVMSWLLSNFKSTEPLFLCNNSLPVLPAGGSAVMNTTQLFRGQNMLKFLLKLLSVKKIIFAGGSIFHGREGRERRYIEVLNSICPLEMGAVGVSVGPFRDKDALARVEKLLSSFSFLVLRDRASYELCKSFKLPYDPIYGFDLAGLLPLVYPLTKCRDEDTKDENTKILGIIPCNHPYDKTRIELNRFREIIYRIYKQTNYKLRFFIFNGGDDYSDEEYVRLLSSEVAEKDRIEVVPYNPDPRVAWELVSGCDVVLSVRLHGAIFALMSGVPFLLSEYHRKCSDFLDEVNMPDNYRIGNFKLSAAEIVSLITSSDFIQNSVFTKQNLYQDKAILNISAIKSAKWI